MGITASLCQSLRKETLCRYHGYFFLLDPASLELACHRNLHKRIGPRMDRSALARIVRPTDLPAQPCGHLDHRRPPPGMARDKKKQPGGTPANEKRPPEHPAALCGWGGPSPPLNASTPPLKGMGTQIIPVSPIHSKANREAQRSPSWKITDVLTESAPQTGFHARIQGVDFLESAKVQAIEGHNLTDLATYCLVLIQILDKAPVISPWPFRC